MVHAIALTLVAIAFSLWLADRFPRHQAKLICSAPKEATKKQRSGAFRPDDSAAKQSVENV